MPLLKRPWLVIDTETTGLPREAWTRPCELGAVLLGVDGQITSEWSSLVNVPCPMGADRALELTGITREEIAAAPPPAEVERAFQAWRATQGASDVEITSYNVSFDAPMMARLWPSLGPWGPCVMLTATRVMDRAGALHRWESGEPKWAKLEEAARFFEVPQEEGAHRALADARVAAKILVALARVRAHGDKSTHQ